MPQGNDQAILGEDRVRHQKRSKLRSAEATGKADQQDGTVTQSDEAFRQLFDDLPEVFGE